MSACSRAALSHFSWSKFERKRRFSMRWFRFEYTCVSTALRAARLMRWWISAVDPVVRRQVAARVAREHLEGQRLHLGDLLRRHVAAGEFARQRFERAHHLEALADVVVGQRDDLRAAIRLQLDQVLGGEQAERLAQRRARGAQPVAQRALVQARAGRQFAFDDQFAQAIRERFGERRGAAGGRSGGDGTGSGHPERSRWYTEFCVWEKRQAGRRLTESTHFPSDEG